MCVCRVCIGIVPYIVRPSRERCERVEGFARVASARERDAHEDTDPVTSQHEIALEQSEGRQGGGALRISTRHPEQFEEREKKSGRTHTGAEGCTSKRPRARALRDVLREDMRDL